MGVSRVTVDSSPGRSGPCGARAEEGVARGKRGCFAAVVANWRAVVGTRAAFVRLVHRENIPARPASDWSI
eukprot:8775156-Pyramimonas_sp.AAC.2